MRFDDRFRLDTPAPGPADPTLAAAGIRPGVYDEGLLLVPAAHLGRRIVRSLRGLLPDDALLLAATGFGHLFFASTSLAGVHLLEVQHARTRRVCDEPAQLFDAVLTRDDVRERVLARASFEPLRAELGPLGYNECFSASGGGWGKARLEVAVSEAAQAAWAAQSAARLSETGGDPRFTEAFVDERLFGQGATVAAYFIDRRTGADLIGFVDGQGREFLLQVGNDELAAKMCARLRALGARVVA